MKKSNIYEEITNKIIKELESGVVPWVQPWSSKYDTREPRNAVSKRPYSGINTLILWLTQKDKGYTNSSFVTFKQALELGGNVKKGEKGHHVVFVKPLVFDAKDDKGEVIRDENGEAFKDCVNMLRSYVVFNLDQCENLPERLYFKPEYTEPMPDPAFDAWVRATGAEVQFGGTRAAYSRSRDVILFPERAAFNDPQTYAASMLHELGHWTGHEKRCNRDKKGSVFGNPIYAFEELVAELTSAFMCASLGFDGLSQSASYLDNWLNALKQDKRFIFTAAALASKASNYLKEQATTHSVVSELMAA